MRLQGLNIALVGPLPPPEGGMANQTLQLAELLQHEGAAVAFVRTNSPYRPRWVGRFQGVRALFRLVPYVLRLWRVAARVELFHVMANSGWSWHLYAAPAIWIARLRGIPAVVNYRGGEAERFLERSGALVLRTLGKASVLAVPSGFLHEVFARRALAAQIVPNIVDTERFRPAAVRPSVAHLVIARSLEPMYDVATALRAFALVLQSIPGARLTVAGSGPEQGALEALASRLAIRHAVHFCGRLDRERVAELYRSASVVINPSRVDNMPNSVLEAMASGAPVVSTRAGGVPFVLCDGVTGLLVAPGDHAAMAAAVLKILTDPQLAQHLRNSALDEVQRYTWGQVKRQWAEVYASVLHVPASQRACAP